MEDRQRDVLQQKYSKNVCVNSLNIYFQEGRFLNAKPKPITQWKHTFLCYNIIFQSVQKCLGRGLFSNKILTFKIVKKNVLTTAYNVLPWFITLTLLENVCHRGSPALIGSVTVSR